MPTKALANPEKLRKMAHAMQSQIDSKRASRETNTPRKNKMARQASMEADHLERAQRCLLKLADAVDADSVPDVLSSAPWTKVKLLAMLSTRKGENGYYDVYDTGEYIDTSETAKAFQSLIKSQTPDELANDTERKRLQSIREMEDTVRFSTIPGFFPTPPGIIELMLELADLDTACEVFEPSAGKGDIADAVVEQLGTKPYSVRVCEVNHTLRKILEKKGYSIVGDDFMEYTECIGDRAIMNPPFEKGQDAQHVRKAFDLLQDGGRIVSVMSTGVFSRSDRKSVEFREWLDVVGGERHELPERAFNGSDAFRKTGVSCCLVVINKNA